MCDCIETINEKLKEADTNTALDVPFMLNFTSNAVRADRLIVTTRKINSKSRKKAQRIFCSYCPFCGEKYETAA